MAVGRTRVLGVVGLRVGISIWQLKADSWLLFLASERKAAMNYTACLDFSETSS